MGLSPFLVDIDAGELPVRNEIDSRAQIGETGCLGLVAVGDGLQADVDLALLQQLPAGGRTADDSDLVVVGRESERLAISWTI